MACSTITDCTACKYNATVSKPQCTNCGSKKVKTAIDGTTTCVDVSSGCQDADHFKADGDAACVLCSDTSGDNENTNKGLEGCSACTKPNNNQPPACTGCLPGYYDSAPGTFKCKACAPNCATCTQIGDDKCLTCKEGFFMKVSGPGECVPCSDTAKDGIDGCATCTFSSSLTCNSCKVNYKQSGTPSTGVTCTRTCEDDTACGGTSGACDAMIIDDKGTTKHYCSYCGETNKIPIDGKCVDSGQKNGNTCDNHICTSCTTGYFLYMGGCYSVSTQPGKSMCKTAANGVCTAVNENNKYFVVPEATNAQQSVLACGNSLGTLVDPQGTAKAYVGVDGCSQCTAPTALTTAGMTVAVCTACDSGKKPNKGGSGCVTCSVGDCKSCVVDNICGECVDGYSLDNGKCVSMSTNRSGLSTGAIAGISVAVIAVVGGLVGFLCWWFVCRGKA
eukprot:XP_001703933.1 VSP [Giardia lamblia ATCC 50803]